jgi:predicted phosphoribosyltransferase
VLAKIVAQTLNAPLDVVISRKIGAPGNEEFGIGAISENEGPYFAPSYSVLYDLHSPEVLSTVLREKAELRRRIQFYRHGASLPLMNQRTVIVVDDGLATGVSAIAAGLFLRTLNPLKLILAVPVAPDDYARDLRKYYDEIVCPFFIENLMSVGSWYRDFPQVSDEEVLATLGRGRWHQGKPESKDGLSV